MFGYKGYSVWYNNIQRKWMIQAGYDIVGKAATVGAAKGIITKLVKKEGPRGYPIG